MAHTDPEAIKPLLRDLGQGPTRGRSLTREEARQCLDLILDGRATPAQAGALLLLQRYKGETPDELLGFVDAVRARPTTRAIAPNVAGVLDVGSPYDGRQRHIKGRPAAGPLRARPGCDQGAARGDRAAQPAEHGREDVRSRRSALPPDRPDTPA